MDIDREEANDDKAIESNDDQPDLVPLLDESDDSGDEEAVAVIAKPSRLQPEARTLAASTYDPLIRGQCGAPNPTAHIRGQPRDHTTRPGQFHQCPLPLLCACGATRTTTHWLKG